MRTDKHETVNHVYGVAHWCEKITSPATAKSKNCSILPHPTSCYKNTGHSGRPNSLACVTSRSIHAVGPTDLLQPNQRPAPPEDHSKRMPA